MSTPTQNGPPTTLTNFNLTASISSTVSSSHMVIRALLPNEQRTTVPIHPGQTLSDALQKSLQRRELSSLSCAVFVAETGEQVDWGTDVALLEGREIEVKIVEDGEDPKKLPLFQNLSHNFVRKTFFRFVVCEYCSKILWNGLRCQTCGIKFHPRCSKYIPITCSRMKTDNYFLHLLSQNSERSFVTAGGGFIQRDLMINGSGSSASALRSSTTRGHRPPPLQPLKFSDDSGSILSPHDGNGASSSNCGNHLEAPGFHRERSTSAPNVAINLISLDQPLPEIYLRSKAIATSSGTSSTTTPTSSSVNYSTYTGAHTAPLAGSTSNSQNVSSNQRAHSTSGSPTSTRAIRPRARSADESQKKKIRSHRESIEDWEIPYEEILTGPRIGSGSFGTVYSGHWHGPVALKKLKVAKPTEAQLQEFKNEMAVLRKTRHVNIILFMGCVRKPQLTIVTQWCEGSSLYKHLHVMETNFKLHQLAEIARQTAQGMGYLHAKNIIHRDLKSNNIFLLSDLTVKIGDFGLATVKSGAWGASSNVSDAGDRRTQQPSGSILWMAPEIIRMMDRNPYTFQSDVYAYGIVLFELGSNQLPYKNKNNRDQIIFCVGRGYLRPDFTAIRKDMPKSFTKLLKDCIAFTPDTRPMFPQILTRVDQLARSIPKIERSTSEPFLRYQQSADDFLGAGIGICPSPKTPINSTSQFSGFPFGYVTGNI